MAQQSTSRLITNLIVTALLAGVGIAIIGSPADGAGAGTILATGGTGDLNLTGIIRTVLGFTPFAFAIIIAFVLFGGIGRLTGGRS